MFERLDANLFIDRKEAGQRLAEKLKSYRNRPDVIVLGLPRGGVPVAFEVAMSLNAPLDVFIIRKIGVPDHPELAMGAIASGGTVYLNDALISRLSVTKTAVEKVIAHERKELERREQLYRAGLPVLDLNNRQVILVDDGLATGASMLAAARAVRLMKPKKIIVAIPVIASSSISEIEQEVDNLFYVLAPDHFYAVGQWYRDFGQTTDEEVQELVSQANSLKITKSM